MMLYCIVRAWRVMLERCYRKLATLEEASGVSCQLAFWNDELILRSKVQITENQIIIDYHLHSISSCWTFRTRTLLTVSITITRFLNYCSIDPNYEQSFSKELKLWRKHWKHSILKYSSFFANFQFYAQSAKYEEVNKIKSHSLLYCITENILILIP